LDYYENYSKIFPNYIILYESKYLYKNIQRKQKIIDNIQMNEYNSNKKDKNKSSSKNIFDTDIYNSIMNQTVSVYQSNKENSLIIKNKKHDINLSKLDNSKMSNSLEKLIERINLAEEVKNNPFHSEPDIMRSDTAKPEVFNPERRTMDVSPINRKDSLGASGAKIFHSKIGSDKHKLKYDFHSDLNSIKSFKEKLADCVKSKYESNTTYATNKSNCRDNINNTKRTTSKHDLAVGKEYSSQLKHPVSPSIGTHKATLSMPKLTNKIFIVINNGSKLLSNNTIHHNLHNKNSNVSPSIAKDFNMTNGLSRGSLLRSNEKKKSYKKLLRPELLSSVIDTTKKSTHEIQITKVTHGLGRGYPFPGSKTTLKDNTSVTRNVKIYLSIAF
jgi:hypothetical protein